MSTYQKYDPTLFVVERWATDEWVTVPLATFSYDHGYLPDENGTLIFDSESATVSLSFWDEPGDVLYSLDQVRVTYDDKVLYRGTVDSTTLRYTADPAAKDYGATRRVDFTASVVGSYAAALGKVVDWGREPDESAKEFLERYGVTVVGYGW